MEIILKDIDLKDNMMNSSIDENKRKENFILQLNKYLYYIDQILNTNMNDISDEELYALLSPIYNFELSKDDYLNMLSNKNGVKYDTFTHIKTCMVVKESSGKGPKNLNFGNDIYCYEYYIVAKKEGLKLKEDHDFTKKELIKYMDCKILVPVYEYTKPIVRSEGIRFEKYEYIPYENIGIVDYKNFKGEVVDDANVSCFMQMVRKQINNFNVLDDLKVILLEIEEQLDELIYENKNEHIAQVVNEAYGTKSSKLMKTLRFKLLDVK